MTKYALFISILVAILTSSCASILGGSFDTTRVVQGTPENAKVYFNGEFKGFAPTTFRIPKKSRPKKTVIEIKAEGYKTAEIKITRKASTGFTLLNLFTTAGLGLILDFANGNIYKIRPNYMNYHLERDYDYNPSEKFDYAIGDTVYFKNEEYDGYRGVIIGKYPSSVLLEFNRPPSNKERNDGILEEVTDHTEANYMDIAKTDLGYRSWQGSATRQMERDEKKTKIAIEKQEQEQRELELNQSKKSNKKIEKEKKNAAWKEKWQFLKPEKQAQPDSTQSEPQNK